MRLQDIRIGTRHRAEGGDVRSLAASIDKLGLLHPVVVDGKNRLVAGARRLAAVKSLGWKDVPVRVVRNLSDAAAALTAERDENTERQAFRPSEQVSIARALEPLEQAEAKKRQGTRTDRHSGKLPGSTKGDRRDKLAAVVGVSGRTLDKARAVVEAAERDPRRYGSLVAEMDRTGNISAAFAGLQRLHWEARAENTRLVSFPKRIDVRRCSMADLLGGFDGDLDAIVCDPPYDRASVPLYGELARLGKTALRPNGVLAVLCGQSYVPDILRLMTEHLPFRWLVAVLTPSPSCHLWQRKVKTQWKPMLVFGEPKGWISGDVISSADSGRLRHKWEQSEDRLTQLVEKLTEPGWLVCDPFLGSGTTAVACLKTGRRFVGCDIDAAAVRMTRARLSERLKAVPAAPTRLRTVPPKRVRLA